MIPPLIRLDGAPYEVLPSGIHWATLSEIAARFATTKHRAWLFEGVMSVADALRLAGCRAMFLDGSYVTSKDRPDDFDGCWNPVGVDASKLDPVLLDFSNGRATQKKKYRGEMFICSVASGLRGTFLGFFQIEKHTGASKGIIGVRLDVDESQRQ